MIPVKIKRQIYIRKGPGRSHDSLAIIYPSGKDIIMDGIEKGETWKGIDDWYFKINDKGEKQSYWAGGAQEKTYNDKKLEFVNNASMNYLHNNSMDEANWKISWGHVDLDIWRLWKDYNCQGEGIRIAIIDTGIDINNSDLTDAVKDKKLDVRNFVTNDENIDDDIGHGTECASIAIAKGKKLFGIAPLSNLVVAKVKDKKDGDIPSERLLRALKWCCIDRNAHIISMSFNTSKFDNNISDFINKQFIDYNRLFVASIGNDGDIVESESTYPANYNGCISVGAVGRNRIRFVNSSWNKNLNFLAPGDKLKGYSLDKKVTVLNAGTSYSCPFFVGLLSCILSYLKKNSVSFNAKNLIEVLKSPDCTDKLLNHNQMADGFGIVNPIKTVIKIKP